MIRTLEEYSLNALPTLQTFVYDGWLLRLAKGYTKRANSVNPLYSSTLDPSKKILECERLYAANQLPAVFKITPVSTPNNLDALLAQRGYRLESAASVQVLPLPNLSPKVDTDIVVSNQLTEEWLEHFCTFNQVAPKNRGTLQQILENLLPSKYLVALQAGGRIIGCGLGVLQSDYLGLYDIVIDRACRNQGYGRKLVLNLLKLGARHGAQQAYLQVLRSNTAAWQLYSSLGFKEAYPYWYRIKD